MNPYLYPMIPNQNQILLEELKCIKEQLMRIESRIEKLTKSNEKNYLEKDDNYYII